MPLKILIEVRTPLNSLIVVGAHIERDCISKSWFSPAPYSKELASLLSGAIHKFPHRGAGNFGDIIRKASCRQGDVPEPKAVNIVGLVDCREHGLTVGGYQAHDVFNCFRL